MNGGHDAKPSRSAAHILGSKSHRRLFDPVLGPNFSYKVQTKMADLDAVALSALIISIIALTFSIGQLLQQYFATADGYRRCLPSVMGRWGTKSERRWRWREFRFETIYYVPDVSLRKLTSFKGDAVALSAIWEEDWRKMRHLPTQYLLDDDDSHGGYKKSMQIAVDMDVRINTHCYIQPLPWTIRGGAERWSAGWPS